MNATSEQPAPPGSPTPIDPDESAATQSMVSARIAHEQEWVYFYCPINTADQIDIETLTDLLSRVPNGKQITLPTVPSIYYLFHVEARNGDLVPYLIPEGQVTAWVLGIAATYGREAVELVEYRVGVVPA